jgi:hypothetical protein
MGLAWTASGERVPSRQAGGHQNRGGGVASSLGNRGYGKPPQHITGESGPSYVVRLPEVAKSVEEWEASVPAPRPPSLPASDQVSPKPEARIEGGAYLGLLLEVKKPVSDQAKHLLAGKETPPKAEVRRRRP